MNNTNTINLLPPSKIDMEESVIAGFLTGESEYIDFLYDLDPDDFYKTAHQKILKAIVELEKKENPITLISVSSQLRDKNQLEEVGGASFLANLYDNIPKPSDIEFYIKKLKGLSVQRKIITISELIKARAFSNGDPEIILDYAQHEIMKIDFIQEDSAFNMEDLSFHAIQRYEDLKKQKRGYFISTGYYDLDKYIIGLFNSQLVLIAGRPSMGKTAFALNLIRNIAQTKKGIPCFFSLEMSKEELIDRFFAIETGINGMRLRSGELNSTDAKKIHEKASSIADLPIIIDDTSGSHYSNIVRKAKRYKKLYNISVFFIDYLHLIKGDGLSQNDRISSISENLKKLAKDLKVPVIALSQLNRKLEERNNKKPMLSDLRDSGSLEQDADVVMFIYRDEVYNEKTTKEGIAEIIIAKQRAGATGIIEVLWDEKTTQFKNLERRH